MQSCLRELHPALVYPSVHPSTFVYRISSICRRWRAVASIYAFQRSRQNQCTCSKNSGDQRSRRSKTMSGRSEKKGINRTKKKKTHHLNDLPPPYLQPPRLLHQPSHNKSFPRRGPGCVAFLCKSQNIKTKKKHRYSSA